MSLPNIDSHCSSLPLTSTTSTTLPAVSFEYHNPPTQQLEQVQPLSLPPMISTTTLSHPPGLIIPSPTSPHSSASPSLLSAPSSFEDSQNQNSHLVVVSSTSSTNHCPPMLPRVRSQSSNPLPGATSMTSSSSYPSLPSNSINQNTTHLSSVAMNMSRRPSLPVNHLHHHHPMERQRSFDPRRQLPGFYLQQQALLQEQFEQQKRQLLPQTIDSQREAVVTQQLSQPSRRPSLTPLSPSWSMSSLSSASTLTANLSSSSSSSVFSSATIKVAVRHPLWQLNCKSCKMTLCRQAMLGYFSNDPDKKLFSTNLAIGLQEFPDRQMSGQCPCKSHLFACSGCGNVCGYKLVHPCEGCETNRGNGHFWIFYANEIVSHWRRTKENAEITIPTTREIEIPTEDINTKESLYYSQPIVFPSSGNEQGKSESKEKQDEEIDTALANCQLSNEKDTETEADGRLMYWDDLSTWKCQSEGDVGR